MAVIETKVSESKTGYKKRLDSKAEQVVLNIVQVNLYTYPFKSMVRELCSNALDSIREKRMAISILEGKSKVSDYFVEKEGELYEDSGFDPTYYDPQYLSKEDTVTIEYHNRVEEARDLFVLKDSGVGLGGKRLEKFFTPGYSSKRLNVDVLGSYGLGSKSPLSTLVEFYTVKSVYNGKEFAFDVYVDKVDSVYSKWNEDGTINDFVVFDEIDNKGEPMKVYYKNTFEKNSVTIEVEVKKHNKHQVVEALKSQLMYFKEDIRAYDVYSSNRQEISFKAKIIHETEDIILSDSTYFNRPHFVLKGVNYGLIDFRELELDSRHGNIGIKVDMSEVDVHPSRESITYTPKTRETVLKKYNKISEQVSDMLNAKLQDRDFLKWTRSANSIRYSNNINSGDNVLQTLSNLIDKSSIDVTYKTDSEYKIKHNSILKEYLGNGIKADKIFIERNYRSSSIKRKVEDSTTGLDGPVVFQFCPGNSKVTSYLLASSTNVSQITLLKPNMFNDDSNAALSAYVNDEIDLEQVSADLIKMLKEQYPDEKDVIVYKAWSKQIEKTLTTLSLLKQNEEIINYKDVKVPEDFKGLEEGEEGELDQVDDEAIKKLDYERYKRIVAARKAQSQFIFKAISKGISYRAEIKTTNIELKKSELPKGVHIYGETSESDIAMKLGSFIENYSGVKTDEYANSKYLVAYNDFFVVGVVAKSNLKYFENDVKIQDFGLIYDNNGKLTTYDFIKEGLRKDYIKSQLDNIVKHLPKIDLRGDYLYMHNLIKKYKEKYLSVSSISVKELRELEIDGLNVIADAWEVNLKLINNPKLNEVEVDDIMTSKLDIDIVDSITGINLLDEEVIKELKLIKDYLRVFGDYSMVVDSINKNSGVRTDVEAVQNMFSSYFKINKHLLSLEHENLN